MGCKCGARVKQAALHERERLVFWADFQLIHKHISNRERRPGQDIALRLKPGLERVAPANRLVQDCETIQARSKRDGCIADWIGHSPAPRSNSFRRSKALDRI